jgi:hypothetical protein
MVEICGWKMESKVMAAIGGCAVLAGVAYILQGGKKTADDRNDHLGINIVWGFVVQFDHIFHVKLACLKQVFALGGGGRTSPGLRQTLRKSQNCEIA